MVLAAVQSWQQPARPAEPIASIVVSPLPGRGGSDTQPPTPILKTEPDVEAAEGDSALSAFTRLPQVHRRPFQIAPRMPPGRE